MLVAWVAFPVVLGAIALGCGLLLERAAGTTLPGVLLLPLGLAAAIVIAQPATLSDATAELGPPVVLAAALAGLVLGRGRLRAWPDGWALACAGVVFLVFSAPFLAYGEPTLGGYIRLDDTASWLALADRALDHGSSTSGLAPSTYEAVLDFYLGSDYPLGGLLPFAIAGRATGEDLIWLYQPYLSFLAAMVALTLYGLAAPLLRSRPLRAVAVAVASQSALLVGFAFWGGFKELAAAFLVPLVAALAAPVLRDRAGAGTAPTAPAADGGAFARGAVAARGLLPLAVASAALLGVLSTGGAVWLLALLVPVLVAFARARGTRAAAKEAGVFAALVVAMSVPPLLALDFLGAPAASTITQDDRLANLIQPLSLLQLFGIWPAGDFRLRPDQLDAAHVLVAVVAAAAAAGAVWSWRHRGQAAVHYLAASVAGSAVIVVFGSAWVDAKALAVASPAVVLAAMAAAAALLGRGRRVEAVVLAAAIAGGVLWSNVLAFTDVNLAPHDRFAELERIGERIDGEGPTLMTEFEPFGVRYLLRHADPEGASELRRRQVPLRDGSLLPKPRSADIDAFRADGVLVYRTLVLRRSPVGSRPPSAYRLVQRGRHYDVWQRSLHPARRLLGRLPLGGALSATATARCQDIARLARAAGPRGRLVAAEAPPALAIDLSRLALPAGWRAGGDPPGAVVPSGAGRVEATARIERPGAYRIWLGGSVRGAARVEIDGRRVARARHQLSHAGNYVPLADVTLRAGTHHVRLELQGPDAHPGSGGAQAAAGPLVLVPAAGDSPLIEATPGRARSLCGRPFDWIEATGT